MSKIKSLSAEDISTDRVLGRRSAALLGGAIAGTAATLGVLSTTGCCMGGSSTPTGTASGCSDSDPTDGAGHGTHCAGGAAPAGGMTSGCSDSDPNDPAGNGSHCAGGGGMAAGCSDSDPNDPAGAGTHC